MTITVQRQLEEVLRNFSAQLYSTLEAELERYSIDVTDKLLVHEIRKDATVVRHDRFIYDNFCFLESKITQKLEGNTLTYNLELFSTEMKRFDRV